MAFSAFFMAFFLFLKGFSGIFEGGRAWVYSRVWAWLRVSEGDDSACLWLQI